MITGTITAQDYLSAMRLHRRSSVRRQMVWLTVFVVAGTVIAAFGHLLPGCVLLGAGVGGMVGELVQSKFVLPRRTRRIHGQQASMRDTYEYSWDDDSLTVSSRNARVERRWKDYLKMLENDELLLLYQSDVMFEMFPKSWFQSEAQARQFRALASECGGPGHGP